MSDRTHDRNDSARQDDKTSTKKTSTNDRAAHTGAGQEATHGTAPGQHDDEPQSNYGGGGENGGSGANK